MLPFEGLRVLELASVLAGPSVGQFFAELGARVVKIENPATGGDVTRQWKLTSEDSASDISAYFSSVNWGKKSVALDLRQENDLNHLYRLIAETDIVIASYKPGDAEKLGVDFATLKKQNTSLIYGQITGYGASVNRAGYDAVLQAECGFMYLNGQADGPPTKMPVALIDLLAGHQLKEGILTALYLREKSQEGRLVEVSLQDAAIASLANQAANFLVAGQDPKRIGSEHPTIAPYGSVYTTLDQKQLVLAVGDDRQYKALCRVLNQEILAADERFRTNFARVTNRKALQELLADLIGKREREELLEALIKANVPAGAVNMVSEVFAGEAAQELLLHAEGSKPGLRTAVFRLNGELPDSSLNTPPTFGKDTTSILG